MKKVFVILVGALLLLSGSKAIAQRDARMSFGGGFSGFTIGGADAEVLKRQNFPKMIPGFYFGVSLDYAFSVIDGLTLEPGAYIFHYGKTFRFGLADDHKSYHANFLQIPLNLKYAIGSDADLGLSLYTGPRLNIGVGGNMFSAGKTYPGIKPLDAQWGFGLGIAIAEAIELRGEYDLSLTNCLKDNKDLGFDDEIIRRNAFSVGIKFMFK